MWVYINNEIFELKPKKELLFINDLDTILYEIKKENWDKEKIDSLLEDITKHMMEMSEKRKRFFHFSCLKACSILYPPNSWKSGLVEIGFGRGWRLSISYKGGFKDICVVREDLINSD